jgi:hypothetical protein
MIIGLTLAVLVVVVIIEFLGPGWWTRPVACSLGRDLLTGCVDVHSSARRSLSSTAAFTGLWPGQFG